jgi:hypothetical protein
MNDHIHETATIKEQIPSEWGIGTVQYSLLRFLFKRAELKISIKLCFQILKTKVYWSSIFSTVLIDHYFLQEYIPGSWHT